MFTPKTILTKLTEIIYTKDGVKYKTTEKGHLTKDSVIMALLKRQIGKSNLYSFTHKVL